MSVGRDAITQQRAAQPGIGALALEVVPAYLSDRQAEDSGLARLANDIGITTEEILACRRYAMSGDVRAGQICRSGSEKVRPPAASGRRAGAGAAALSLSGWRKSAPCSTGSSRRPLD
ncbi:hypothetical protein ACIG0C_30040 [Kitasatospora aureofaciens]|uniref:Uncharacterized protein n=1 Tax=Kitasatospora aureofaciens TaxID=1894 RepID=A0A1E7NE79_KITAU|nr:hypothetical protein [Kitasatospora aureofaciens]OEV38974.1 hypothetical protein HS99_0017850 [Kitasatospora aureofaciens]GGU99200.1 hypothetical protein GCM10010502_62010 [Kitasatospora aureofaciens]